MRTRNLFIFFGLIMIALSSCEEPVKQAPNRGMTKKELIEKNRQSVRIESDQIDRYIKRRDWNMVATGSGLRYLIYENAEKDTIHPTEKDRVKVHYSVSLINGQKVYQSNLEEPAEFIVGNDDVESGLQEGIRFLTQGDKAIFIIPSHLAHGYTGDFDKIPHSSTVIFDIELVEIIR